MAQVAKVAADILKDTNNNAIILSGSGTSGRMAFVVARVFNKILLQKNLAPCYHYLCAGGDIALFCSRESPEDNWKVY